MYQKNEGLNDENSMYTHFLQKSLTLAVKSR
jgi:hypothetical protein